jgi:dihydrofolate synthase/folylpolyglutamate synthase
VTIRDRLFALQVFGIKLGLDNIATIVESLGHPERAYPTIHVAGTNGKGSVCAMVERALRAAGYRTGLYTSPHLDRLEERIAIEGLPVEAGRLDDAATDVFAAVDAATADGRLPVAPTFFEVTTAIAFDVFRAAAVDVAVIEVGLGGRFDATNIVTPRVSAITSIAFDHERHLGTTLAQIAGEKAGIAKPGVPLVVGRLPAEALEVVRRRGHDVGAPILPADRSVELLEVIRGRARVRPRTAAWPDLGPLDVALLGRHQVDNAATAVRVLEAVDGSLPIPGDAVSAGLTRARWPARLEWLRLAAGDLLIDAAHNPAGAAALASYLRDEGGPRMPLVLAAMQDKDVEAMARALLPVTAAIIATGADTPRAFAPQALASRLLALAPGADVTAVPDPQAAIARALQVHGRAVAAGSIYFVGPLRARLIDTGAAPI